MQERGAPDVKGCIFSLGATLWYCADYSLEQSEEPEISQTLQSLLLDMTQAECGVRPGIVAIDKVYTEHMGLSKRNLRSLYSHYNKLQQAKMNPPVPQLPSIQIIINKDGLNHVANNLEPGDNIPITYPGYISADSSFNNLSPSKSYNPSPAQSYNPTQSYTSGPYYNKSGELHPSSDSFVTPLFHDNPQQTINKSDLSSKTYLIDEEGRNSSDIPQFNLIEATMLEDSPIPRTRSTHDLHHYQPPPYPLPDFNLIEATQLPDLTISSGEFSPIPQTFTCLTEGMNALFSQMGKLSKSDRSWDALPPPEVDSSEPLFEAPNTPLTSSPKQEPLLFQDISISPIKELDFDESAPLSESIQRRRRRSDRKKSVEFTQDFKPVKRNSLVECLSNLDDTDNLAKDFSNPDILDLLNLDLDASDVLEFLEDRIEVNLDKLEKGNTIVNSLAGAENDISFKRLQVESMSRVVKRDDLEISQVIFDVNKSGREEEESGKRGLVRRRSSVLVEEQEGSYLTLVPAPSEQKKKVSIPIQQLLGFFTSNLSQQDSSEVLQALQSTLLDLSEQQEEGKRHDLSTIAELSELVQHTPRVRPARLLSTCSVEEQLNFSVTGSELHEEGSNSLVDISSAYGRTSPDGTHSPQTPPVGYSEHYFSDAESEREDSYYKIGAPPKYFDDTLLPLSSDMPSCTRPISISSPDRVLNDGRFMSHPDN